MNTMSAIRAYVGGEGLWSKAQKESVNSLVRYSISFDESDYQESLDFLKVPLGDRQARLELEKKHPDISIARKGFLDGGNHPDDVSGLIFLFQKFRTIRYMSNAIDIWAQGDVFIEKQADVGSRIHTVVASGKSGSEATALALRPLLEELISTDVQLTKLENQFSAILGEASRRIGGLLFGVVSLATIFLSLMALFVALFIAKIVTQVDKAKSEFIALASHQLRTPLTVIKLSTEVLGKANLSALMPEEKKALENISYEVPQMISLIDTILDVSRIELGTLVVNPKKIDVIAAVAHAVAEISLTARKKGMQIQESYNPESLVVPMDASLLHVILQNLLSNAIKYSPQGGKIDVSVVLRPARILIRISDTGYGIPKEQQGNIFGKLFRAANTSSVDPGGTGLGLYIVKSIVTKAGGTIWFESKEGEGTSFYVAFPRDGMEKRKGNVQM